jgi:hypothetical protein
MNINEVEAMIICKLYVLSENNNFLSTKALLKQMNLSESDLSNHILDLVNKGYIELTLNDDNSENFSIDGVINRLGEILEAGSPEEIENKNREKISFIINYVETVFQRVCNQNDLIIINQWIKEGYDTKDIQNAILDSQKAKKAHLKYADAILTSRCRHVSDDKMEVNGNLKEMLDSMYGRNR